jgi:hypothetical protein
MKSPNQTLRTEEFKAQKAVQQIQKCIEKKYPGIAASVKMRMIIEFLIEITEERRVLAQS